MNPYTLRDHEGHPVLGPFNSIPDAHVLAQRLATKIGVPVRVCGTDVEELIFTPA